LAAIAAKRKVWRPATRPGVVLAAEPVWLQPQNRDGAALQGGQVRVVHLLRSLDCCGLAAAGPAIHNSRLDCGPGETLEGVIGALADLGAWDASASPSGAILRPFPGSPAVDATATPRNYEAGESWPQAWALTRSLRTMVAQPVTTRRELRTTSRREIGDLDSGTDRQM